ncbi:retron Ec67 family RNA-directed DNA polymerase/endonuclease [Sinorhizobium fredii]|uniref:retron Ec67 family RNA-directed DNA polymerase/endonuclease n=1 Tax=Rhizobium fredii TaxID=380 RepID=UPI003515E70C
MSELSNLRNARTLPQLARLLGVEGESLSYALYWYRKNRKYTSFTIAKKSGGRRLIDAPNPKLKYIQHRLAEFLSRILAELEASRTTKVRVLSHGFKDGHSIITNASLHRKKRYVFNTDIKDFFPSINFGRVYGFFIKDRNFRLDPKIATIIAQIACHNNSLPQGSPCSPVISNLITHILDLRLNKAANEARCTYTRYADDLTFSTNEKEFPEGIARLVRGSDDKWVAGDAITRIAFKNGFRLNHDKSRMQRRDSRQDTTGLIVNEKLNVRHEYFKRARAMCHHLFEHGYCHTGERNGLVPLPDETLDGIMTFIYQIRRLKIDDFKGDQRGFSALYKRFLDYRSFHGLTLPRIICEGKTDNIYIRSAIKRLAAKFPLLIDPKSDPVMQVEFFNYSDRTALFQELSGGTNDLSKLLGDYRQRISSFKHDAAHPVIMVVDNDNGSKGIFSHLQNMLGKPVSGLDPFYHVYENLYVVPVPKAGAAIEDLFDPALLARTLDGKKFNKSNKKFDLTKFYGKNDFATRIVAPERNSIDFSGFEAMLQAICDVTVHYRLLPRAASPSPVAAAMP